MKSVGWGSAPQGRGTNWRWRRNEGLETGITGVVTP